MMRNAVFFPVMVYSFLATGIILSIGGKDNFQFGFLCIVLGIIGGAMPFFIDKYWPVGGRADRRGT